MSYFVFLVLFICIHTIKGTARNNLDFEEEINKIPEIAETKRFWYGAMYPLQKALDAIPDFVQSFLPKSTFNRPTIATARHAKNNELCQQEQAFIAKRKEIALYACNKQWQKIKKPPCVALCLSGGGLRALFSSLGFMQGLTDEGLFDAISYISCLSGSTWTIAPWITHGGTLGAYETFLKHRFVNGLAPLSPKALKPLLQTLLQNTLEGSYFSGADIFGCLLAQALLPPEKTTILFSDAHTTLTPLKHPFPIYTAIATNVRPYEWIEITPYEIGSTKHGIYAPTWAINSRFEDDICTQRAHEKTLGFFLGTFGSAFSLNLHDLLEHTVQDVINIKESLPHVLRKAIGSFLSMLFQKPWHQARLAPALLANFAYNSGDYPLAQDRELALVDAGIDCNLPLIPLLDPARSIDIIIVYDVSAGSDDNELKKALKRAMDNGFIITWSKAVHIEDISLRRLHLSNGKKMVVVYIPWQQIELQIQHQNYASTFNFTYLPDQVATLCSLGRATARMHGEKIWSILYKIACYT